MMRKWRGYQAKPLLFAMLCGVTSSCAMPIEPGPRLVRDVGFVKFRDDVGLVDIDTVNGRLEVLATTLGGGCSEPGDTEVHQEGNRVWITPYDFLPALGTGCDRELRFHEHRVAIDAANVMYVVIRGREAPTNSYLETTYAVSGGDRDVVAPSAQ